MSDSVSACSLLNTRKRKHLGGRGNQKEGTVTREEVEKKRCAEGTREREGGREKSAIKGENRRKKQDET